MRNTRMVAQAKLFVDIPGTDMAKRKMEIIGADLFNSLPPEISDSPNMNLFKMRSKYYIRNNVFHIMLPSTHLNA